jgi:hypothetical protein
MAYTLQQSINFAQTFIQYSPLSVGTGLEPAISLANEIQTTILNQPFCWPWNRNESTATPTIVGTQDYTIALTDFSFLEKITLKDPSNNTYEILDIKNSAPLGIANTNTNNQQRPNAAAIILVNYGTNLKLRLLGAPDMIYQMTLTYQKLPTPIVSLGSSWGIPDQYIDIYNNLFVGEAMALVDDARSVQYRQRGVATLLSKAEGLTEMQKDLFLQQYWLRDRQQLAGQLRTQQAQQARGI